MKKIFFIVTIGLVLYSCNQQAQTETENKNNVEIVKQNFDWLLGKWIRTNDKGGVQTFENWEKKSDSEYIGLGYIQNSDKEWEENIKLIKSGTYWSFDVSEKGDVIPTKFKLTVIEERKFICENQDNEFPKAIEYKMVGDTLHAKISGNGKEVLFEFKKIK
ncbi:MAG: hypothetical protein ABIP35_14455 [Ginsengibacter sp.]